jgi:hypothetical protein
MKVKLSGMLRPLSCPHPGRRISSSTKHQLTMLLIREHRVCSQAKALNSITFHLRVLWSPWACLVKIVPLLMRGCPKWAALSLASHAASPLSITRCRTVILRFPWPNKMQILEHPILYRHSQCNLKLQMLFYKLQGLIS